MREERLKDTRGRHTRSILLYLKRWLRNETHPFTILGVACLPTHTAIIYTFIAIRTKSVPPSHPQLPALVLFAAQGSANIEPFQQKTLTYKYRNTSVVITSHHLQILRKQS